MKRTDRKSHCPVNFALETVGDPWSLLIVRDIVFHGKHTFGEFLAAQRSASPPVSWLIGWRPWSRPES